MERIEVDRAAVKEYMRRQPLFAGLSDQDLEDLVAGADVLDLEPGFELIREGDEGDRLYVVLEGDLEVSTHRDGRDEPLGVRARWSARWRWSSARPARPRCGHAARGVC